MVDTELVQRAQHASGDEAIAAYREVVLQNEALMHRAAYLASGSQGAAGHITEDAFVKAFADLDELENPARFRPWMLKIVTDEALDFRHATDQDPSLSSRSGSGSSGRRATIIEAMNHVSDFDRVLLSYHYTLNLPDEEIAGALGISVDSYAGRLADAERSLNRQVSSLSQTQSSPTVEARAAAEAETIESRSVEPPKPPASTETDEGGNAETDSEEQNSEGASS